MPHFCEWMTAARSLCSPNQMTPSCSDLISENNNTFHFFRLSCSFALLRRLRFWSLVEMLCRFQVTIRQPFIFGSSLSFFFFLRFFFLRSLLAVLQVISRSSFSSCFPSLFGNHRRVRFQLDTRRARRLVLGGGFRDQMVAAATLESISLASAHLCDFPPGEAAARLVYRHRATGAFDAASYSYKSFADPALCWTWVFLNINSSRAR